MRRHFASHRACAATLPHTAHAPPPPDPPPSAPFEPEAEVGHNTFRFRLWRRPEGGSAACSVGDSDRDSAAMDSEFSDAEAAAGGEENAPVYCVCRKPDINCFMIGCDNCNEWFHGDCINITEKMAKAIREWYCHQCREKDATLEIRYRHKKWREKERDPEGVKAQELALEQGRAAK
ncbi:transcription initiation factor TFIID subunit 3-like, partial [Nyctibius grandis]|uniref:transcription initiation factor TFIID subunit 3-like n=1 Tax=Nyctibius grandis TaxID=48427 RepID=UPI0035BC86D3